MSLTLGHGPFSGDPAGEGNYRLTAPEHIVYLEPSPRRVRGVLGGETVVDSLRPSLLHETGLLPVYYFPRGDVRMDLLEATDHATRCPFKGRAAYWTVRAGGREAENAAWAYPEPLPEAPAALASHLAFYWEAMDAWYEEDQEIYVHPRDPYHRVDLVASDRHVRVRVGGHTVAESDRAVAVFETGLPPRWYLPREDVEMSLLEPSDTVTRCPYKGEASYFSVRLDGEVYEDLVWTYPEPLPGKEPITGRLAFYDDERVELDVTPT